MKPEERLEYILENYGIERILEDNRWTMLEVLDLLEELGYICLDMYVSDVDDVPDYRS